VDARERSTAPGLDPGISTLALRSIAVLIVISAIVGRGLTDALRGWRVGLGDVILRSDQLAAALAQFVVVAGAFLAIRLLIPTIRERRIEVWYRLGISPVVPAIVTTVFAATTGALGGSLTFALALATSALALCAAAVSLGTPAVRAAGIVLGLSGAAAFVQLVARVLAMRASDGALESLFNAARWLATAGLAFDLASLVAALLWLAGKSRLRLAALAAVLTATGALSGLLARRGVASFESIGHVSQLVSRTLSELVRHPRPMLEPPEIIYGFETAALLLALIAALSRARGALATTAISLAISARAATDIPVHALALTLGALLVPLAAAQTRQP
jgi:hypothetical protein